MGPTLSGRFREVVDLGSWNIDMGESFGIEIKQSIKGSGRSVKVIG